METKQIAEILSRLTGADPAIVADQIEKHGLRRFMNDFESFEGLSSETKERLDDLYLFVLEGLNHAKG